MWTPKNEAEVPGCPSHPAPLPPCLRSPGNVCPLPAPSRPAALPRLGSRGPLRRTPLPGTCGGSEGGRDPRGPARSPALLMASSFLLTRGADVWLWTVNLCCALLLVALLPSKTTSSSSQGFGLRLSIGKPRAPRAEKLSPAAPHAGFLFYRLL